MDLLFKIITFTCYIMVCWALSECVPKASLSGTCKPYPFEGVCKDYVTTFYYYDDNDFESIEAQVARQLQDAQLLLGIPGLQACYHESVRLICKSFYFDCFTSSNGEAVPVLPCIEICQSYWDITTCGLANEFYFNAVLQGIQNDSRTVFCGENFVGEPPAIDIFGGRNIPNNNVYPVGYTGQARFPNSSAQYTLLNSTVIDVSCSNIPLVQFSPTETCGDILAYGLSATSIDQDVPACLVPCPFVTYSDHEYLIMYLMYVIPGLIGGMSSLYVFIDSCIVINRKKALRQASKAFFARALVPLRPSEKKNELSESSSMVSNGSEKKRLQTVTCYAFWGSLVGLMFLCVGTLPVAFGSFDYKLGCPEGDGLAPVEIAGEYTESFLCMVNRTQFFWLQLSLNIILYAIAEVHISSSKLFIGTRKAKQKQCALISYCVLSPVVCLLISLMLDNPAHGEPRLWVNLSRWTLMCAPRLTFLQEFFLLHVPLLASSIALFAVAVRIYYKMYAIKKALQGSVVVNLPSREESTSKRHKNTTYQSRTQKAVTSFRSRLALLGILSGTFSVIFVADSLLILPNFEVLGNKLDKWFTCTFNDGCGSCKYPEKSDIPPTGLVGLQFTCISLVTSFVSVFFMSIALERRAFESESLLQATGTKFSSNEINKSNLEDSTKGSPHDRLDISVSPSTLHDVLETEL